MKNVDRAWETVCRDLWKNGHTLFRHATSEANGTRTIRVAVLGLGSYGSALLKALCWFCQMPGYDLQVYGFDKDPLIRQKLEQQAPELLSERHNGVKTPGDAQYQVQIVGGVDVTAAAFEKTLAQLGRLTWVAVLTDDGKENLRLARHLKKRLGRRTLLRPLTNGLPGTIRQDRQVRGTTLERAALARHEKWGDRADFFAYGIHYRSSVASAMHLQLRKKLRLPGADKPDTEMTAQERYTTEVTEHCRWNAFMRGEGYVYSGSTDPASRNDREKKHHNLVPFSMLSAADQRKDSRVASVKGKKL